MLLIGICGPSTSGKTTLCKSLVKEYNSEHIEVDNYLKAKKDLPEEHGFKNWELPENIRFDVLMKNLEDLKEGKSTKIPIYECGVDEITKFREVSPKEFIFVEGYYIFHNKEVRDLFDIKIYLDISEEEILKRKAKLGEEGCEWVDKIYLEKIFLPAHRKYAVPQKKYADFVIDGTLSKKEIKEKVKISLKSF